MARTGKFMETILLSRDEIEWESGKTVRVQGLLLGKGNCVDGGKCWLVTDWESRNDPHMRLALVPARVFVTLLDRLEAFGGGEYSLYYTATATGCVQSTADGEVGLSVQELAVKIDDDHVVIDL